MQDLTGKKFNRLLVKKYAYKKNHQNYWECECDRGNIIFARTAVLKNGHTQSCGCYAKERASIANKTHGYSKEDLYVRWCGVKSRCYNKNNSKYEYYGGRGIHMCNEWKDDYLKFREWALKNGYKKELKLDRIDNNKEYSPFNCRWITHSDNMRNTRVNKGIIVTDDLKRIAKNNDLTYSNVRSRYYRLKEKGIEPTEENILNYINISQSITNPKEKS